jgi:hypothetical protein
MNDNCPCCGLERHENKKHTYVCGTWKSVDGDLVQSSICKTVVAAHLAQHQAELERDRAQASEARMLQAKVEAEHDRDLAIEISKDPIKQITEMTETFKVQALEQLSMSLRKTLQEISLNIPTSFANNEETKLS